MMAASWSFSGITAVAACAAMAVFYVAILYSPTLLLRLPPPTSIESFMLRRFACAVVSSLISLVFSSFLLGVGDFMELPVILNVYGIRSDHAWQAVVFPLLLTGLLYTGSFVSRSLLFIHAWKGSRDGLSFGACLCGIVERCIQGACSSASDVLAWRNYVVAPITEELVFRACMIPLLLCGGLTAYSITFFSPIFFSLAHLNHFLELYYQQRYNFWKAFLIVGNQLGYTIIFGWYASFLFIRTGNVVAPIVAHIFCNMMGLPVFSSPRGKGIVTVSFAVGVAGFFKLLFPATRPDLFNDKTDDCSCWHGYCNW
ncbi:prenyl protein peptidase protein [Dioscorea alata]|uniref:Prenyl protein peptidase protein n=1 Tax=Dioscorea alata TaxID=55571 RepID=A0ACB7VCP7_DIOAL|nr:prenyl protein peptidase protein [Dioscorea alata]